MGELQGVVLGLARKMKKIARKEMLLPCYVARRSVDSGLELLLWRISNTFRAAANTNYGSLLLSIMAAFLLSMDWNGTSSKNEKLS